MAGGAGGGEWEAGGAVLRRRPGWGGGGHAGVVRRADAGGATIGPGPSGLFLALPCPVTSTQARANVGDLLS